MSQEYAEVVKAQSIFKVTNGQFTELQDQVVVEEPLEIQIRFFDKHKWQKKQLAVTMRTPKRDAELAIGFLFTEGIIGRYTDIESIQLLEDNVLIVNLIKEVKVDLVSVERNFYATSSCGLCGKASIEKLTKIGCFFPQKHLPKISIEMIQNLPEALRKTQSIFEQTGGIHAAGLFEPTGNLLAFAEDVGRHNAVDKLIGHCLKISVFPLRNHILMLSGRVSFELVQKAMMAGVPIIAAVGAPSSLAIELAEESGITLIGFVREGRLNVYSGIERFMGARS